MFDEKRVTFGSLFYKYHKGPQFAYWGENLVEILKDFRQILSRVLGILKKFLKILVIR